MLLLIVGLVLFLGAHTIPFAAAGWREAAIARFGEMPWKLVYGLVSAAGLVLIVVGYGAARQNPDPIVLYTPPVWTRHLSLLLMVPVFVLLSAAYLPGRIKSVVKHPMLLAVQIWASAHLLANGTLAAALLFGGFLVWGIADRVSMSRRGAAVVPGFPASRWNDWAAVGAGAALYVAFLFWLHRVLIGVSPLGG